MYADDFISSREGRVKKQEHVEIWLDVSENRGTPKSSILIGFSIINHPFWGTLIFGNTHLFFSSSFGCRGN